MSKIIFLIFTFLYIFQNFIYAKDVPIIVIAPSKISQSYSTVGSSISSIDSETIDKSNDYFISDILDTNLPGMNYFRSGGYGTISGIQLRGLPKRYSTVYIDGVKMSDPSSSDNSFYFSNIVNSSIETMEVLRGSQSSIYGSGAIGGTINIYTKDGKDKNVNKINVSRGSDGTKNVDLSFGNYYGNHDYYFGLSRFNTDGISAMNDAPLINDDDSYDNESFITNYGYAFNENYSFRGSLRYSDSFLKYDEVKAGRTDNNNSSEDTEISYNLKFLSDFGKSKNSLIYNYTNIERDTKSYTNSTKIYYGYRDALNFISEYNFNLDTKIIFGLDNEFDRAKFQKDWPTDYLESDEAIYSQYLDIQFRPSNKIYSTIGFRRDDHTTAGNFNTGRITMAYVINNLTKIRSSYGTGLRYPSLYDYFYGTVVTQKEDLKPEKSKSFDIGYETYIEKIRTDIILSAYKIEYKDPLEGWQSNGWTIKNSNGTIKSKGIEFSSIWKPKKKFNLSLNYNYSDTYDGADCDDPNVGDGECIDDSMVRVPRHALSTIMTFKNNKNLINKLSINYSGEVRDYGNTNNGFSDVILDDYLTFGYKINYNLNNNYNIYFNVDNIFDQNYEKAFMYSAMGRSIHIGMKKIF